MSLLVASSSILRALRCSDPTAPAVVAFHYAGGNSRIFAPWLPELPASVNLLTVQLPGRDERRHEPLPQDLRQLARECAGALQVYPGELLLFGHSMGALLAYETALQLQALGKPVRHLLLSARPAPQLPVRSRRSHLTNDMLIDELRRLGGTPQELLQNPQLLALVLPVLRADYAMLENYHFQPHPAARQLSATLLAGRQDRLVSPFEITAWRQVLANDTTLRQFDGDHFYLHNQVSALCQLCAELLQPLTVNVREELA
ncbi:thioesterase II family protein [Rheinheimera tilapiae]|jgi:surfactin synthase thioesterase subunit|uniref:Thioesterase II family protein n=1 Tax=Rheinheimera tilapiae TaxID=875043 RepID=A0ABV6B9J5_9GAMM